MTNYSTQCVLGPVVSPFVARDKGDFSNRAKCAGSQVKNNAVVFGESILVGGGAIGAAKMATKSPKFGNGLVKVFDKMVKVINPIKKRNITAVGKHGTVWKTFEISRGKLGEKLLNISAKNKKLAMILLPATLLLSYIGCKGVYKMGQTDQKYTDLAKIEAYNKNNILA